MALNKSMHPRNRYKDKPPDFAYLASKYPDFQKHVQTNLVGRVIEGGRGVVGMKQISGLFLFAILQLVERDGAEREREKIWATDLSNTLKQQAGTLEPVVLKLALRDQRPVYIPTSRPLMIGLRTMAGILEQSTPLSINSVAYASPLVGPRLNFKDPEAVRALTCTLLKEDFGLTIEIPLERLIPTVPLRLNYIHWVEDLTGGQGSPRRGIDIGTGASCIYPLLGASMNGWHFLATEVDDICYNYAKKNVEQNNMADLIKVVKVPQKTLLMDALKEESIIYDFCMCNPPFFANQLEAKGVNSRNSRRPPPSSVNTGGVTEIMAEGGELEFVKRIIHDSLQLKRRLRWYSCMLGKKCSLAPLKEELRKQGVSDTSDRVLMPSFPVNASG
ncbi:hypothetical protein NFI96_028158, partial [Prochilodus magdalenae]